MNAVAVALRQLFFVFFAFFVSSVFFVVRKDERRCSRMVVPYLRPSAFICGYRKYQRLTIRL